MSICRWSSDSFKSDLYIYEDMYGGYTTHVAKYRHLYQGNDPIESIELGMSEEEIKEKMESHRKFIELLEKGGVEKIGLPYDGETFNDDSAEELYQRVMHLKKTGYRVPKEALRIITQLKESEKENGNETR